MESPPSDSVKRKREGAERVPSIAETNVIVKSVHTFFLNRYICRAPFRVSGQSPGQKSRDSERVGRRKGGVAHALIVRDGEAKVDRVHVEVRRRLLLEARGEEAAAARGGGLGGRLALALALHLLEEVVDVDRLRLLPHRVAHRARVAPRGLALRAS